MNDTIRAYILDELLLPGAIDTIDDDDDLLTQGILSSMQFVRLISYLEKSNSISIPAEDLIFENFQTLNLINSYLATRINS